ncbi:AMP-binding protein [Krasilnikovia sp. MM14-A1259]|uniref:AMP-binding protein n=1 Tax=Krasilnikovia sp. MM14-A1259 TaxID=3373539 RepID=UPI00382978E1
MGALWEMVYSNAGRWPDASAVRGSTDVTYAELMRRVHRLRGRMRVEPGQVVAIDATPSVTGLTAILAALAADAVFVPLDRQAPETRRNQVLRDSRAVALVTEASGEDVGTVVALDADASSSLGTSGYLMYTSGSTGTPKGVLVAEDVLLQRLRGLASVPGFGTESSILALTALSFDICLAELLLPLIVGGAVVTAPAAARLNHQDFTSAVDAFRPTVVQATPSFFRLMIASGWDRRLPVEIWCGGEALTADLAANLLSVSDRLWNMYGPTEATIWATAGPVSPGAQVSLGDPLPGTRLELRSPDGEVLTGPGAEGEIVLTGDGIAEGYVRNHAVDRSGFVDAATAERCYATGDRARYRSDLTLEFLGRIDGQIKIRGHRIELGDIEAAMLSHPDVVECAAFGRLLGTSDAHIVAVVSATAGTAVRDLRHWLRERLPLAYLPREIKVQATLPHSTAGKINRSAIEASLDSPGVHSVG